MAPDELKPEFGRAMAGGANPYPAALSIGLEMGAALWVAEHWKNDPVVLQAIRDEHQRLRDEPPQITKSELVERFLRLADSPSVPEKDRIAALNGVADVMGWKQKASVAVNQNNQQTLRQKVIGATTYATDEDWEAAAARQQSDLLNVATNRS